LLSDIQLLESKILVVDDNIANVLFIEQLLELAGYTDVRSTTSSEESLTIYYEWHPQLVILDLHMPVLTGYDVLQQIRAVDGDVYTPVLVFTADVTSDTRRRALDMGASDFLTKPGDATEILLRVRNFLRLRHMIEMAHDQNLALESRVKERTYELQTAYEEVYLHLAKAGEYRDDDTGEHAGRVSKLAGQIARELGLSEEISSNIELASALHDLGKIGIPDSILLKPGKLTQEEYEIMKTHTTIGASVLHGTSSTILRLAQKIAVSHHERWDGKGYPMGTSGENIPIGGRIVAVADTFDAIVSKRPYKESRSPEEAFQEILNCAGHQFDPKVVEAFERVFKKMQSADIEVAA
jgi:putative two-component system response regulator